MARVCSIGRMPAITTSRGSIGSRESALESETGILKARVVA
jgi:hypothetical protein